MDSLNNLNKVNKTEDETLPWDIKAYQKTNKQLTEQMEPSALFTPIEEAEQSIPFGQSIAEQASLTYATHNGAPSERMQLQGITPQVLRVIEPMQTLRAGRDFCFIANYISVLQDKINSGNYEEVHSTFARQVSSNSIGVPKTSYLVNSSKVIPILSNYNQPEDFPDSELCQARLPITMEGEWPCIHGEPIWNSLHNEPADWFVVFKIYRDMSYTLLKSGEYLIGQRSLVKLAKALKLSSSLLKYISQIYHWQIRIAHYDNYFRNLMWQRKKQVAQLVQSDHLKMSQDLARIAFDKLSSLKTMTAKDAINLLELGLKYSRLSAGLDMNKPTLSNLEGNPLQQNGATFNLYTQNNHLQVGGQSITAHGTQTAANPSINRDEGVVAKVQENLTDSDHLLSILHVLHQSGAIASAVNEVAPLSGNTPTSPTTEEVLKSNLHTIDVIGEEIAAPSFVDIQPHGANVEEADEL